MSENRQEPFSVPATGGISLLTVFAVLCLTVFALLSLSTVRADGRLGEASAQAASSYYAADREAQTILAQLRCGLRPESVQVEDDGITTYASYACPISDSLELQVEVELEGESYTVRRWQAAPVGQWETDSGLNVWDGEFAF